MRNIFKILALLFAVAVIYVYVAEYVVFRGTGFGEIFEFLRIDFNQWKKAGIGGVWDFIQYMIFPWAVMLLIALAGYGSGAFFIRLTNRRWSKSKVNESPLQLTDIESILLSIGIGMSFLSVLVWVLGWLGLLYKPLLIAIIIIIVLIFYKDIPVLIGNVRGIVGRFRKLKGINLVLPSLLILWVARTMMLPCNPSVGGDPLSTHLFSSKLYLSNHVVSYDPRLQFLQLNSMLVTLQMAFFRDPGSVLPYFFMLMAASTIYLIGRQFFNRYTGLAGAAIYVLMPMSHICISQHLIEHALVLYILLAFYALLKYHATDNSKWLILAGAMAGSACGIDINGLIPAAMIIVLAKRRFWQVLLWVVIFASPWYLVNVIFFGNPLHPFYGDLFKWARWGIIDTASGSGRDIEYRQQLQSAETSIWGSLTALWRYTFDPQAKSVIQPVGRVGPFLLALTPMIFLAPFKKPVKIIGIFILTTYIYWLFYERYFNARFLIYIFALHGVLAAWGLASVVKGYDVKIKNLIKIVFAVILVIFATQITLDFGTTQLYFAKNARLQYVFEHKPGIVHVHAINKSSPDSVVYMLGLEYYLFYCDFEAVGGHHGRTSERNFLHASESPAQLHEWLKSLGCDLLLVNLPHLTNNNYERDYGKVMEEPDWELYFEALEIYPGEFSRPDMATKVFRIKDVNPAG